MIVGKHYSTDIRNSVAFVLKQQVVLPGFHFAWSQKVTRKKIKQTNKQTKREQDLKKKSVNYLQIFSD